MSVHDWISSSILFYLSSIQKSILMYAYGSTTYFANIQYFILVSGDDNYFSSIPIIQ